MDRLSSEGQSRPDNAMNPIDWITTSTILDRLGDPAEHDAWERFVGRFRRPVVNFAIRMGHSSVDAEDVAQETLATFVELFRAGRYDRSRGRLSKWLFGIAMRVALNKRRGVIRRAREISLDDADPDHAAKIDAQAQKTWDQAWEMSLFQLCLDRVKQEVEPMTLRAFELVVRSERSPADVAKQLDIPVKAVYNAKYTVLKRLRAHRSDLDATDSNAKEN